MKIKLYNANIITMDEKTPFIKNGTICIENDKIIAIFNNNNAKFSCDKEIDVKGDIIMPGFVNAHSHNAMILFRGIKDDVNLQEWLFDYIFPMEKSLTYDDVYYATKFACMQSVQSGITTVLDEYFYSDAILKATKEIGMRAFIPCTIDLITDKNRFDFLNENHNKVKDKFDDLCKEVAYCHSVYTQSCEQIEDTIKYAKENKLLSTIHCSENLNEVGECANANNDLSPVAYLEKLGYFDNPSLIAHAVCVDKDDILLLKQYNVSVVTNPASNLKLGSGFAPLQSMLQNGINICIGTDGSGSNNGIDFFRDMYLTATLQKGILNDPTVLSAKEVIKMATINGAKALGLNDVGMIKKGYQADIIRINTKSLAMNPINDYISNIVYSASKSDVVMTMIAGKIVYENENWQNVENVEFIVKKCQESLNRLKKQAKIK